MTEDAITILHIAAPLKSVDLSTALLVRQPFQSSPTFAMPPLGPRTTLGPWALDAVEVAGTLTSGGTEHGLRDAA